MYQPAGEQNVEAELYRQALSLHPVWYKMQATFIADIDVAILSVHLSVTFRYCIETT